MPIIKINQEYFDTIKLAIDGLNQFFESDYNNKNFVVMEENNDTLDPTIANILEWIDGINVSWIKNPEELDNVIEDINTQCEELEDFQDLNEMGNEELLSNINSFIGYKMLLNISEHFNEFSELINGIYSFELFTKPSMYQRQMDIFTKPTDISELHKLVHEQDYYIFDVETYVSNLFECDMIEFPKELTIDGESERITTLKDSDCEIEIVKNSSLDESDETEQPTETLSGDKDYAPEQPETMNQESADINYFEKITPADVQYDNGVFTISDQFKERVNNFVSLLEKCDTIDDLLKMLKSDEVSSVDYVNIFTNVAIPFILAKSFSNPKKYKNEYDHESMHRFTDSYQSIMDKNAGARRFANYDLFSVFKVDKDSTIDFIRDYLTLDLVNKKNCVIKNNILLTLFNIFDSHIYLEILYNVMTKSDNTDQSLDEFIKTTGARINKNSRNHNIYQEPEKSYDTANAITSEQMYEFVNRYIKSFGVMSHNDSVYCEAYQDLIKKEISLIDYLSFKNHVNTNVIVEYASFMESSSDKTNYAYDGSQPDYFKEKMGEENIGDKWAFDLNDKIRARKRLEDEEDSGYKLNKKNDRADEMANDDSDIPDFMKNRMDDADNMFADQNEPENPTVKNYDLSNQSISGLTNSVLERFKFIGDGRHNNTDQILGALADIPKSNLYLKNNYKIKNNINNSIRGIFEQQSSEMNDLFTILEADVPPSNNNTNTMEMPKEDLMTKAMDNDRKTLPILQKIKQKTQKASNTAKAVTKPLSRVRENLTRFVDNLFKKDENRLKRELMENSSFRGTLRKAARLALKVGMFSLFTKINGLLAAGYAAWSVANAIDTPRIKKEFRADCLTEIKILQDKLNNLNGDEPEVQEERAKTIRMITELQRQAAKSTKQFIKDEGSYSRRY